MVEMMCITVYVVCLRYFEFFKVPSIIQHIFLVSGEKKKKLTCIHTRIGRYSYVSVSQLFNQIIG